MSAFTDVDASLATAAASISLAPDDATLVTLDSLVDPPPAAASVDDPTPSAPAAGGGPTSAPAEPSKAPKAPARPAMDLATRQNQAQHLAAQGEYMPEE